MAKTWWCSYCLCVIGGPDGPSLDGRVPMASSICCKCGVALITLPAKSADKKQNRPGRSSTVCVGLRSAGFAICSSRGLGDRA